MQAGREPQVWHWSRVAEASPISPLDRPDRTVEGGHVGV
jgi:hypothetical protein